MATPVERRAQAERLAQAFLASAQVTVMVLEERAPDRWRCELRCATHPGAPDLPLDVAGSGYSRGGALDLAHAELHREALEHFLEPRGSAAALNERREALVYEPGPLGARRVLAALAHRHAGEPPVNTVLQAGLHCSIVSGGTATIGDVVRHLLAPGRLLMSA